MRYPRGSMARRHGSRAVIALLLACAAGRPVHGQVGSGDAYARLLDAAVDLDHLWSPIAPAERLLTWAGLEPGPALDPPRDAERVMVRAAGAGLLARLWLAEPRGVLRFYVGGSAEPIWEIDAEDLLVSTPDLPGWPFVVHTGGGGLVVRLPVPFRDGIVVTTDAAGSFEYQAQVCVLDVQDAVSEFDPAALAGHASRVAARLPERAGRDACTASVPIRELPLGGSGVLAGAWTGPGVLRETRIRFLGSEEEFEAARRGCALRFVIDGADRGSIPLGALRSAASPSAHVLSRSAEGADVLRVPVPCRASLRVELCWDQGVRADSGVRVEVVTEFEARELPAGALDFHAVVARTSGDPRSAPHVAVDASGGAGRFGGVLLIVDNPSRAYWGGGGERFFVDGSDTPTWCGTGFDAYIGAALASGRAEVGPFEGQPIVPGRGYRGRTHGFRFHVLDAVPFASRLRLEFERRPFGGTAFGLETVAFVYAEPSASVAGGDDSVGAALADPVPARGPESLAGLPAQIEGEDLRVVEVGGGEHQVQRLNEFSGARWSGDAHLWWLDGEPGDRIKVAVPVPAPGRYRLLACWTTARDYGIARVLVGGVPVGGAFDLYSEQVRNTGLVEHGVTPSLEAGEVELEIELTGRNEKAVPRHMVGLDYLRLVPAAGG